MLLRVPSLFRRRAWGIRTSSTAVAVIVVAGALAAGGLLLLLLLQNALTTATDSVLRTKAHDVAALVAGQDVNEAGQAISTGAAGTIAVQILDSGGHVVHASEPALASRPLSLLRPAPGTTAAQQLANAGALGAGEDYYVVAVGVSSGSQQYVVLAAQNVQVKSDTLRTVALFLLLAAPFLLLIVGVSVWYFVGRSLRQVELIRAQVEQVSPGSLGSRVGVPPTRDELQALAVTMNAMLERIEAADVRQRQFLSHASHELRSPLTSLRTGLEVASSEGGSGQWKQLAPLLAGEARRMGDLIEDLLTLSKSDDAAFRLERTDVDFDDVVARETARARATAPPSLRIRADLTPVRVQGDARRLAQVVRNVLDNAQRHAATLVVLTLNSEDGRARLTIDNDGPPVPDADRERIFGRFVRLDDSRSRDTGGSGLGLSIARSLTEAHGGTINAGTGPDGLCRFTIDLPQN
ncbi:HAMP domain-containing histidine kinase [Paenarthrobacter sp. DKR-5]|uniref:sensor histidine kinase n=1 Tax=Paenarthrobacter sp. DKR-5 TaxID=2835535 RepID=UPI001BDCB4F3|nr:HAMP domain-containing sensor histidine kinase [Paenarthrobacter sp. DKR-5]MBT1004007.1 HAMP domain-containing histidine kinase [Paenarthrobacter sp. DKR-5]